MNKEMIIKLLKECISSEDKFVDRSKLVILIKQLEDVRVDLLNLIKIDLELLKRNCSVLDDEIDELNFYVIISSLEDADYQLTSIQVERIKEICDKYLNEIKKKLELVDKNQDKNKYINGLVDKIIKDKFVLTGEELTFINKLLQEKRIEIEKINQVMISLSLMIIQELERQLSEIYIDEREIVGEDTKDNVNGEIDQVIVDEEHDRETTGNSDLSQIQFFDRLWDLLNIYGLGSYSEKFVKAYCDDVMKTTNLNNIEDILKALKELNINLSNKAGSSLLRIKQLLCFSSREIIQDVVGIVRDNLKMDNQESFDYVFEHIAIFVNEGIGAGYQNFKENMRLFKSLELSKELFSRIPVGVLCEDSKRIMKNVLIMEKYKIPREKYLESLTVLKSAKNCSEELDMWLELGTTESKLYLEKNLSMLINNQIKDFGRKLRILRDLHINITVKDTYKTLNKKLFQELDLIDRENIVYLNGHRCVVDFVPYMTSNQEYDRLMNKKEIDLLEDRASKSELYQRFVNGIECVDNLYYHIPGVNIRISKNKVYRVFNNLICNGVLEGREMLIYAITYKSVISEDEYNSVCLYVDQLLGNSLLHKGSVR